MYMLIPNVRDVEANLNDMADILGADEILLFERSTFLVIAHAQRDDQRDIHRFEKISNIFKEFKLSCSKIASQFQVMKSSPCSGPKVLINPDFISSLWRFGTPSLQPSSMCSPQIPTFVW